VSDRYRVNSRHNEDIASGAQFGPGEWAIGVDPDHPFDRAKIDAGILIPEQPPPAIKATEAAEKKAAELGIDLSTVTGTGSGDQITIDDVEAAQEQIQSSEEESK